MPLIRSALFAAVLCTPLSAQEWPRFRGPNGSGVSEAAVPTSWTEKDIAWRAALPGTGNSSPVAWGDRLFVTAGDDRAGTRYLLCFDVATGKELWRKESTSDSYKLHKRNAIATSTPVADEKAVYVSWATPEQYTVAAFDHGGKQLWQQDLGPYKSQHGFGVSPIRVGDLLIVPNDQDGGGSVVGLNAKDGKVAWTIPRKPQNATYSTPCVFQQGDGPPLVILTNWQHGVTAVDPKAGKVAWEISVFNTKTNERSIASPVVAGDLIIATCGFVTGQKHHVALRVGKDGRPAEAWRVERQVAYMPTPVVKGDRVYLMSEQGWATCVELQTGKEVWQERVGGNFSAAPVIAGEHLYCVANDGAVQVLKLVEK
jgi:outer membrane protein assembly factor BamB